MRIEALELVNFRSFARARFALHNRTYIVGRNNAGKSSTIDALAWALTGKCRGFEGKQDQQIADLIRQGETEGLGVRVEIAEFGTVQRQTDGASVFLKVKDWSGSNKAQQTKLFEALGISEDIFAALLNTGAFLELHHSDAKRMIMGVLNVRIPAEPLEPFGIAGPLDLDELDAHYKKAFDKRTTAKRDLENAQIAPAPEGEEPPSVAELEADLAEVRDQYHDVLQDGAEGRGRAKAITAELERQREKLSALEHVMAMGGDPDADLDTIEHEIAEHRKHEPPAFTEPVAAAPDPEVESQEKETADLRVKLADERGRLKTIALSVERIEGHDPAHGCVIDGSIPCQTPAKEFKGKLAEVRKEIRALEKSTREADGRLQWLEAEAKGRKGEEEKRAADVRRARAAHDASVHIWRTGGERLEKQRHGYTLRKAELQNTQDRIAEARHGIAHLQTALENLGDVSEPAEAATLRDRIARGEGIIAEARAWFHAKARRDADLARTEFLRTEVARLEQLCEALGPKGLILDVVEGQRVLFETRVNHALDRFGYRLEFRIEPWTVLVNGRKSYQLSKSEQLRVGLCLQLAIAEISGAWFVAIDEVDMLDSDNRALLEDVIEGWRGQIVMCATKDASFEIPEDLPDTVGLYHLTLEDARTHVAAA